MRLCCTSYLTGSDKLPPLTMRILLTGSSGFIGQHLMERLRTAHDVTPYDLEMGDDVRDRLKLEKLFEVCNFDLVLHLAALTGVRRGELYPEEYISTNVMGTKNIVDLCEKYAVPHLINFSSSSVYGVSGQDPITEEHRCKPVSIYGMTKWFAEQLVKRSSIPFTTTIRPFTVYGEHGRQDQVLFKWINQYRAGKPVTFYGDGSSGRGYTYVGDLLDGLELLIERRAMLTQHLTLNLGGDRLVTLRELHDLCSSVMKDVQTDYRDLPPGDQMYNLGDTELARHLLGWKATTNFKEKVLTILHDELLH